MEEGVEVEKREEEEGRRKKEKAEGSSRRTIERQALSSLFSVSLLHSLLPHHLARREDQRRRLRVADTHDDGGEALLL